MACSRTIGSRRPRRFPPAMYTPVSRIAIATGIATSKRCLRVVIVEKTTVHSLGLQPALGRCLILHSPLSFDELLLPRKTPPITAGFTGPANHAMAWNQDRNGISGAGVRNRTGSGWLADRFRDLGVRSRLAVGNRLQVIPDAQLKGRRPDVQREIEVGLPAREMGGERGNPLPEYRRGGLPHSFQ